MRYSGIGGQAVMEGVMMRNGDRVAVAVRLENGQITVDEDRIRPTPKWVEKTPLLRGVYAFFHSLVVGLRALYQSASYFEDEEEKEKSEAKEKAVMGGTLLFSLVLALGIFMVLPFYASRWMGVFVHSDSLLALAEGLVRVGIFILYVWGIGKTEDIRRTYMYHGAEHKCINCIESGRELNVENVRTSSRFHKRCGTSFIFIVFLISILVFMLIHVDSRLLQLCFRLLLTPVIAGVSYEFLRLAGRSDNGLINLLSAPGLFMQRITTQEPSDDMIEVGIASVEKVFDWKAFLEEEKS
ncbi:MAG: DUF1385 domain-containing protein [Lachnospiraceae bacterium]|nr:DUF1385 domain-containing protein [Lachnospiraceae bacterium]MBQ5430449.1 DUF1385 domain-containing protein [Lachnospiraceae bacterium]